MEEIPARSIARARSRACRLLLGLVFLAASGAEGSAPSDGPPMAAADAALSLSTPGNLPPSATRPESETAAPQTAIAAAPAPATTAPPASAPRTVRPSPGILISGSWRVRQEAWDWFRTDGFDDEYLLTGSLLRLSASRSRPRGDAFLELAQVSLLGLPDRAIAPAPRGQLGLGAAYADANRGQDATLFVKQGFWRFKGLGRPENSLRVGRFEFIDGAEVMPKDPSLAWMKRERIAHRLIGNFGWSHVGRSFDALQFAHAGPGLNLTLFGGIPTRGVFDLNGMDSIPNVKVGYAAVTRPLAGGGRSAAHRFQGEARLFGLYYEDTREVVKTDNRPQAVRALDRDAIGLSTVGGHVLGLWNAGRGKVDGLLWGAGQFGDWGQQSHAAHAVAAEVGYQPEGARLRPWFRAGILYTSGDDDPTDGDHETFFPVLPTPRIYARFPFFTTANLNDAFGQVILRPNPRLTVRTDWHALWLSERADLWYSGGGAFQDRPSFGYAGRPSQGERGLATLLDVSAEYQWRKFTQFALYVGYARGGEVIDRIYAGRTGLLGYLEATQRW